MAQKITAFAYIQAPEIKKTMNEEQAVLDFFSKPENLPLALSVAERIDEIRVTLNNDFWRALISQTSELLQQGSQLWRVAVTDDKNTTDQLVGLHCDLPEDQPIYLRPMLEQQLLGGVWRIYGGLMWSTAPTAEHLQLPAVIALKEKMLAAGYKSNESFLAWQWTHLHPRRTDFLLRFSQSPQLLIDKAMNILRMLLIDQADALRAANMALRHVPHSTGINLTHLHRNQTIKSD